MKSNGSLIETIFLRVSARRIRLRRLLLTVPALLVGACLANSASAAPRYEVSPKCKEDPTRLIEVIFERDYRVRMRKGAPAAVGRKQFTERSRQTLHELRNGTWFAMHRLAEKAVDSLVERARRTSPQLEVPDLNNAFVFLVPADICLDDAVQELRTAPEIRFAYPQPRFVPATASHDYSQDWGQAADGTQRPYQAYLHGESLGGLSVFDARDQFGGADGRGVNILVHEGEANIWHEALFNSVEYPPSYAPDFNDLKRLHHGTQTLGMLATKLDSGTGILGIADGATTYFVETGSHVGYSIPTYQSIALGFCADPGNASSVCSTLPGQISHAYATQGLHAGDILLIEKQMCPMFGNNKNCQASPSSQVGMTPVEWSPAMWDMIRALTALNIVVVEPAGNGGVDLDASAYNDVDDPQFYWATPHYPFKVVGGMPVQDSGALIVGASTSGTDWGSGHFDIASSKFENFPEGIPFNWSNHGKRVDLRAWGEAVVTTGSTVIVDAFGNVSSTSNIPIEDGEFEDEPNGDYTFRYGGTSAASPMIAGAAAALQGIRAAALNDWAIGEKLSPLRIRNLLRATGATFDIGDVSSEAAGNIMVSQTLNAGAILGPRPNILRAAQGIGRRPDDYCSIPVPEPRFALEDLDGDGQVFLYASDVLGTNNPYFSFRPIVPSVPPSFSYIAWSTDGSEPTCLYPNAATCTSPASPQHNQRVYSEAQDGNDYSGIPVYSQNSGNPSLLTLPITIKAKTTVVTQSCGVRTSDTVEITYELN